MEIDKRIGLRDLLQVGTLLFAILSAGFLFYYSTSSSIKQLNSSIERLDSSISESTTALDALEDRVVELEKDETLQDYRLSDMEKKLDSIDRKVGLLLDMMSTPSSSSNF